MSTPDSTPQPPGQMLASPWDIQAPYYPGEPCQIYVGGDADPGGRDAVAGDVAGAVANALDRRGELQADTYGQGSVIGDLMYLPGVITDHSKMTGDDGAGHRA